MQHTELHTYLALAGNRRLPHLEDEIFADEAAATIYLHNLCREYWWYNAHDFSLSHLAYCYAYICLRSAWPTAEAYIANTPCTATGYAIAVINKPWPAAEHVMVRDSMCWQQYLDTFPTVVDINTHNL